MRPSLDPRGILLAHTLPALLLFYLLAQQFAFIRPSLNAEALQLWTTFAWWLGAATLTATAYAIVCMVRKQPIHYLYGALVFVVYVPLLWWSMDQVNVLFPNEVPRWMVPEEARLYGIRILSASLLHGLIVLVGASLPSGDRGNPVRDILIGAAIPLCCYLFVQVVRPYQGGIDFERHAWVVVMTVLVVSFLFFVFRGFFAVIRRRSGSRIGGIVTRILMALVLPLLGLLIHNGELTRLGAEGMGLFGDLSHWGFYVAAALNGIVVIWGSSSDPKVRMVQFILRSIGYSYVLYFFVLFLPFLPLGIPLIIAFGFGFLLLAPVLLFLLQGQQLWNDLRFLRRYRSVPVLVLAMIAGLLVLPAIITGGFLQHRSTLHRALAIVYQPTPEDDPATVDGKALEHILGTVAGNKERRGWARAHTPFITPWYNRVVFDNLTLSDTKIGHLQRIFIGHPPERPITPVSTRERPRTNVVLDSVTTRSTYDAEQHVWRTWVDLRMTNNTTWQDEYSTVFNLPPGAYISDEYLVIEGEKVPAILAERKAATWVYQQIRDIRRDPSLTTYAGPDKISLKVFPIQHLETRQAGFEVLHKEPLELQVDTFRVHLGDAGAATPNAAIFSSDSSMVYVPAGLKATLPQLQRPTQVHVIADASVSADERPLILDRISTLFAAQHIAASAVTLHITDVSTRSMPWDEAAKAAYREHTAQGGFFSDRPIRRILTAQCAGAQVERSVILIAPGFGDPEHKSGVLLEGLAELAVCQPDAARYFLLDTDGSLHSFPFSGATDDLDSTASFTTGPPVHAWPTASRPQAWFAVDGRPGTALIHARPTVGTAPLHLRRWSDALALEGRWRDLLINPGQGTAGWLSVVRGSFQTQVLSPHTAWICLESDLQRNALLKKQEETLRANAALDAGEEELVRMSEPGIGWLLLVPLFFILFRRRAVP